MAKNSRRGSMLNACVIVMIVCQSGLAQPAVKPVETLTAHEYDRATDLVQQQIDVTKTFDDRTQRIRVLIRGADLLWPYQERRSRKAFADAFELANVEFEETGEKSKTQGQRQIVSTPDQRYVVIGAIAKRDIAWARKLTGQMLKDESEKALQEATKDPQRDSTIASSLLNTAFVLMASDMSAAVSFARRSLAYPATVELPLFLYKVAESNEGLADQLYREALVAYDDKPLTEFLYLSAYPFGNDREAGDMPSIAIYRVPPDFIPNKVLQRSFFETLLRRAQQLAQSTTDAGGGIQVSETGQAWLALTRLEPQIAQSLPDLISTLQSAKSNIYALLSQDSQDRVSRSVNSQAAPKQSFDKQVEIAEKQSNPDKRDQLLVLAVIRASEDETLEHVVDTIGKISESNTRAQVLDWLYFVRSQSALKNGQFDDAKKRASQVEELDQRAYLYSEIARESLKTMQQRESVRELLEDVVTAASKAPNTIVTARTLLAAAYLYTKVDIDRAVAVLNDAIKCINRLEAPDFSRTVVMRKIESRGFGTYAMLQTPGFTPESTLREVGVINFDSALSQASAFTDKSLRAMTTLALADLWITRLEGERKRPERKKTKVEN